MDRRVGLCKVVDEREHGGDGRFAVASRNCNHFAVALADLPQRHAALQFGNALFAREHALRIVGLDRGGVDHEIRPLDVFARMTNAVADVFLVERVHKRRALAVGAGHDVPLRLQDERKPVHAAPADADQVDALCFVDMCHESLTPYAVNRCSVN
jgi:hypothetical protein